MTAPRNYQQFWPYFMECHEHPWTRRLHAVATAVGVGCVYVAFPLTYNAAWLILGPLLAYPIAWFSHFYFEKKKPAAWSHPYWSFLGDLDMLALMAMGTMDAELRRLKERPDEPFSSRRRFVHHATEVAFFLSILVAVALGALGSLVFEHPCYPGPS